MRKLMIALCFTCALALAAQAEEAKTESGQKARKLTAEQKALREEMTKKYDTNKDGKLDKAEKAKISAEDKEKMQKAGMGRKKKSSN